MQLLFLLSSLVNEYLFSQSGFHVFPGVHRHTLGGTSTIQINILSLHESIFSCCFQERQHAGVARSDSATRESFCGLAFERMDRPVPCIVLLKRCDCPSSVFYTDSVVKILLANSVFTLSLLGVSN
jgi:hypothetical protein